jgi:hypothetical protein
MLRPAFALLLCCLLSVAPAAAEDNLNFPRMIKTRYEATDTIAGGHVTIWFEREKLWYGLDPRLYPGASFVEVTHVVPSVGSPPITLIEVRAINSSISDFLHVTGNVRLKVAGMKVTSSNVP